MESQSETVSSSLACPKPFGRVCLLVEAEGGLGEGGGTDPIVGLAQALTVVAHRLKADIFYLNRAKGKEAYEKRLQWMTESGFPAGTFVNSDVVLPAEIEKILFICTPGSWATEPIQEGLNMLWRFRRSRCDIDPNCHHFPKGSVNMIHIALRSNEANIKAADALTKQLALRGAPLTTFSKWSTFQDIQTLPAEIGWILPTPEAARVVALCSLPEMQSLVEEDTSRFLPLNRLATVQLFAGSGWTRDVALALFLHRMLSSPGRFQSSNTPRIESQVQFIGHEHHLFCHSAVLEGAAITHCFNADSHPIPDTFLEDTLVRNVTAFDAGLHGNLAAAFRILNSSKLNSPAKVAFRMRAIAGALMTYPFVARALLDSAPSPLSPSQCSLLLQELAFRLCVGGYTRCRSTTISIELLLSRGAKFHSSIPQLPSLPRRVRRLLQSDAYVHCSSADVSHLAYFQGHCPKGHPLVKIRRNNWWCDGCPNRLYFPSNVTRFRCDACDFDMCDRCHGLRCPANHFLRLHDAPATIRVSHICDICQASVATKYAECEQCDYLVCAPCLNGVYFATIPDDELSPVPNTPSSSPKQPMAGSVEDGSSIQMGSFDSPLTGSRDVSMLSRRFTIDCVGSAGDESASEGNDERSNEPGADGLYRYKIKVNFPLDVIVEVTPMSPHLLTVAELVIMAKRLSGCFDRFPYLEPSAMVHDGAGEFKVLKWDEEVPVYMVTLACSGRR